MQTGQLYAPKWGSADQCVGSSFSQENPVQLRTFLTSFVRTDLKDSPIKYSVFQIVVGFVALTDFVLDSFETIKNVWTKNLINRSQMKKPLLGGFLINKMKPQNVPQDRSIDSQ